MHLLTFTAADKILRFHRLLCIYHLCRDLGFSRMHRSLEKVLLCLLFCLNFVDGSKQHYDDLEGLQNDLFANYSTNIIPQKEKTTAVKVKFDIALNQIIDLDERLQTMTTIVWVRLVRINYSPRHRKVTTLMKRKYDSS